MMKLAATLTALFAPSLAYRPELFTDENGKRKLKALPKHVLNRGRELQDSMSNSSNIWTGKHCVQYDLVAKVDEIQAGERNTTVGTTWHFPVYLAEDPENAIGLFSDATTEYVGTTPKECIFTGSFVFGVEPNADGYWEDQITVTGTCQGKENTITGGSGAFQCAKGYEYFTEASTDTVLAFTAFYCSGCDSTS